ncbi:MAG: hypothetical protein EU529_03080 [Promethearchaeota archaeon]|nr:MAG: hypothetical protein EU529_03080 [Candidatus Lokiarchaeota archaeon]
MRTARLIRSIARLLLLILASTMSLVSFLGGYSAVLILSDEDNIDFDYSYKGRILDVNDTTLEFRVEFKFKNVGYFDLEDLELELEVYVRYYHEDYLPGKSVRREIKAYEGEEDFGDCESGLTLRDNFKIVRSDVLCNVTDIRYNYDKNPPDNEPIVEIIARDIIITGKYSLSLIEFRVEIEKYSVAKLEQGELE